MWETIKLVTKNFKRLKQGEKAIVVLPLLFILLLIVVVFA